MVRGEAGIAPFDLPSVGYAAVAALVFAIANNVQQDAASVVPLAAGGPVRLILRLLRTPRWLFGSSLAVIALVFHAVALARGGVIVVQAILSGSLILALGIESLRERRRMRPMAFGGCTLLVAGVVLLLGGGRPGGGRPVDDQVQLTSAVLLAAVVAIGLTASRMHHAPNTSAVAMGAAAGLCFAIDAVFLKGAANSTDDLDALPAVINLTGFALASGFGNVIVQRAYQRARLRLVQPAVTAADPLGAFVIGHWLLAEQLQGGPGAGLAVVVGLAGMAVGIVMTTASGSSADPTPAAGVDPA